jgi:hypothetical protein
MTPIEILGTLLRGGPGGAGGVLNDILRGGGQDGGEPALPAEAEKPEPKAAPEPMPGRSSLPPSASGGVLDAWRRESTARPPQPTARPEPSRKWNNSPGSILRPPAPLPPPPADNQEEAVYLIRAMVNAVRADGDMDSEEEQKILSKLGQPSQEVITFIQNEFSQPLDVREFAWSIPLGLEEKVYALSLSVMEVDARAEFAYLKDLAHGLRLPAATCQRLHQQLGAPGPA